MTRPTGNSSFLFVSLLSILFFGFPDPTPPTKRIGPPAKTGRDTVPANVKVHVYSLPREAVETALGPSAEQFRLTATAAGVVTADDLHPRPPVEHLYRYLREAGWVIPVGAR